MKSSLELLKFIQSWEGCKLTPYPDTGGRMTIGIGHLILPHESLASITEDQAIDLLAKDIGIAERAVNQGAHNDLAQSQFDALVSLCYNIGQGNFAKSQCLKDVNAGKFDLAGDDFLNWNHENGKISRGLTRRRTAERDIFLNGVYNTN